MTEFLFLGRNFWNAENYYANSFLLGGMSERIFCVLTSSANTVYHIFTFYDGYLSQTFCVIDFAGNTRIIDVTEIEFFSTAFSI